MISEKLIDLLVSLQPKIVAKDESNEKDVACAIILNDMIEWEIRSQFK